MPGFISFKDGEEMMEYLRQQRELAKRAYEEALEEQRNLGPGDRYVRSTGEGFIVLGEIQIDEEMERTEPWLRFVRAYSRACPEGELGSEYAASMIPISREAYEESKAAGWEVTPILEAEVYTFWERMAQTFRGEA